MRSGFVLLLLVPGTFAQPWYSEQEQDRIAARWPSRIAIPKGIKFYRSTKWVQSSAVVDYPQLRLQNVLTAVPIARKFNEWSVPGGLRGVGGWRSYLGVVRGAEIRTFDAVEYSAVAYGHKLRRVDRSFAGAQFFDLLLNADFQPFELRAMASDGGKLDAVVLWRDSAAAPIGYVRPKRHECVACHRRAGESSYGDGNVPGGGGIFSYPLLTED